MKADLGNLSIHPRDIFIHFWDMTAAGPAEVGGSLRGSDVDPKGLMPCQNRAAAKTHKGHKIAFSGILALFGITILAGRR
jgi:hypothetical protein